MDGVLPGRGFRSSHFYYHPARFGYVESWCDVCDCSKQAAMRSKWYHPVGELKPGLRFDHPAIWEVHRRNRRVTAATRAGIRRTIWAADAADVARCLQGFPGCQRCENLG